MQKILLILSFSTMLMAYPSNTITVKSIEKLSNKVVEDESYKHMSTAQLQKEVEKRSLKGNLSFNMGLELMKRWSKADLYR